MAPTYRAACAGAEEIFYSTLLRTSSCHLWIRSIRWSSPSPRSMDTSESLDSRIKSLSSTTASHSCLQRHFSSVRMPSVNNVQENILRVANADNRSLKCSSAVTCRPFIRITDEAAMSVLFIQVKIWKVCLCTVDLIFHGPRQNIERAIGKIR